MSGRLFTAVLLSGVATYGATININTGVANWQVSGPGVSGTVAAVNVSPNPAWSAAPSGSSWISFGTIQSTSCGVGVTPGTTCANATFNLGGDTWLYTLNISSATLGGVTAGTVSFVIGSDNRVNFTVGVGGTTTNWGGNGPNGTGFNPLSNTFTVAFAAANLNPDGSLTLSASNVNDPIPGCPACSNPTGFLLAGTINSVPEPATFGLVGLAGLAGAIALRNRRRA